MSQIPRYARDDENQSKIVQALRDVGASVADTSCFGEGFTDLVVGYRGVNYLIEVKTLRGQLNAKQHIFHDLWRGQKAIARTTDEALAIIGVEAVTEV